MATVHLLPGRHRRIRDGHPWVYRTEIAKVTGEYSPGDIVDVVDARGAFVARGYINPRSMLTVRVMTLDPREAVDEDLIRRRIDRAWRSRQRLLPETRCCRVVFGEADFLPGLIVDKFEDVLVIQILALGMERWRETIVAALEEIFRPRGIYERGDERVRELEGLPQQKGFVRGEFPTRFTITENGLQMVVDVEKGQKTGHYLDQRLNRAAIRPYARDARVLDAFCNTGGFALNAAAAGAREVVAVDSSAEALAILRENAALNGLQDRIRTEEANAFDFLRAQDRAGERYDLIILDPPAFAKNRAALEGAIRGYKEINLRALRMLREGGILVTCSCSYHMTPDLFAEVIADAARDARRRLRLIEARAQPPDHPMVVGYPESHYLKCYLYEVL
ncbi:MAG: class I SAM-dependent rRNA methyltransferase [Firmicutes bacterium]|nr:class I SAM-dependent rRNA methyltransferase [Bacillota bacterium]